MTLTLKEAEATLEPKDAGALKTKQKISECIELLNYRQNLVNMAASSEHGWKVVQEYTSNPLGEDSDDDKKIQRAQTRRKQRKSHRRSLVSATTVLNVDIGRMFRKEAY